VRFQPLGIRAHIYICTPPTDAQNPRDSGNLGGIYVYNQSKVSTILKMTVKERKPSIQCKMLKLTAPTVII
jgi:hypothetical protein